MNKIIKNKSQTKVDDKQEKRNLISKEHKKKKLAFLIVDKKDRQIDE